MLVGRVIDASKRALDVPRRAARRIGERTGPLARIPHYVRIAAVVGLLTWPVISLAPEPRVLDPSWQAALHMSFRSGLHFGRDVIFTYGPLGFLALPTPHYSSSFVASTVLLLITHFVAVGTIAWGLSRGFGPLVTAVLTYVLSATVLDELQHQLPELVATLICIACAKVAVDERPQLSARSAIALAPSPPCSCS